MLEKKLDDAEKILKKYYGYSNFRQGQDKIIKNILSGNDTFAIMPTGAGKSICFQIPAMLFDGLTLVISPLISLMKNQVDALSNIGLPASFINSSLPFSEVKDRIYRAKKGQFKLLYIAPERFDNNYFRDLLKSLSVSLLVVDEAHCTSHWGHDFRPSYLSIGSLIGELPARPVVSAFTATATEEVRKDIIKLLGLRDGTLYITGFNRENLCFSVLRGENKQNFILNYLEKNKNSSCIIYCSTRKEVDELCEILKARGFLAGRYHAGLTDEERTKTQEAFTYDDINIIVATNAFGMGIDKSNVRSVIHYNMPKNMEAYYQEAGRAGRDGEKSDCILLFSPRDIVIQRYLIEHNDLSPERKDFEHKKLQSIIDYCHTGECLRKYILQYFGEEFPHDSCEHCSNCNDKSELTDITVEAQKVLSCVYRMEERFGMALVAQVLKGSRNIRVLKGDFDKLSTHGIMKDFDLKDIKDFINTLIADKYLSITEGEYPVLKLNERSWLLLKNKEKILGTLRKIKEPEKEYIYEGSEERESLNNILFDLLKTVRKDIARREGYPPYVIFHDSTLREMSIYCPLSEIELLNIKGVGEGKAKKYGHEFVEIIKKYVKEENILEIKKKDIGSGKTKKDEIPSHVISLNMYKEGKSLEEIARERDLKIVTVKDHLIKCACAGMEIDLNPFIPKTYEALILDAVNRVGAGKLAPIKYSLPEEIDYFTIRAVLCKHKLNKQ